MSLRQNLHRSNRSNAYSESKCSHWGQFNPYYAPLSQFLNGKVKPTSKIEIGEQGKIHYFETPLHRDFVRPYTFDDIVETLKSIPERFLRKLKRIIVTGGSRKQRQTLSSKYCYGSYFEGNIALFPFPQAWLKMEFSPPPPPHLQQQYLRFNTKAYFEGNGWIVEFNEESLKKWFMRDVLIHEIGHHVDWLYRQEQSKLTEEFAEWFTQEYGPT